MRCDQCNKFVSFEEAEPEVNDLSISDDGQVIASVRIVNLCAECSQELTDITFDVEADHSKECADHKGEGHELEVEDDGCDRESRQGYFKKGVFVSKVGRYGKMFYGMTLNYSVKCSCGKLNIGGSLTDECQASGMDKLV